MELMLKIDHKYVPNIISILVNVTKKTKQDDELDSGQVRKGPLIFFSFECHPTGNTEPPECL